MDEHLPIGIIIVAHGKYGSAILRVAETIMGPQEDCVAIGVDGAPEVGETVARLTDAAERLDRGDGVLVVTDMFGGTPTNLALSLLGKHNVEVVTGVNLPMLLKVMELRSCANLADLANEAAEAAKSGVVVTGRMLRQRKGDKESG